MIECVLNYNSLTLDGKLELVCNGIGTYNVVTGKYGFKNDVNCSYKTDAPIPVGIYYIAERKEYSFVSTLENYALEKFRNIVHGISNDKSLWFSLISVKTRRNEVDINGNSRGGFKLHPLVSDGSGYSAGCITLISYTEFLVLRREILRHRPMKTYLDNKETNIYGTVRVIGHPDFSKCTITVK